VYVVFFFGSRDMFQNPGGIQALLKEGGKHFAGMDEALLKNIDAAKQIGTMTRSSFGPFGLNKLIVNHLDKHFITRDAAVILEEMEVVHPAAKLVVMAAKAQEQECGDGTNLVTIFAGELLNHAEELLKQGIHASDVVRGYELAIDEIVSVIKKMQAVKIVKDPRSTADLVSVLESVIATKQYGQESFVAQLVAQACVSVMPEGKLSEFVPDNVRVATMTGSGVFANSHVVSGVVCPRDTLGNEKLKTKAKVAVYSIGIENAGPETSGTVLIKNANELLNFTKGEESRMEEFVKSLVAAGVDAIVTGGNVQDIALHFLNKYHILVIKCTSKFELRRLCETLHAVAVNRMGPPLPEETGYAESIEVHEISSHKVTIVKAKDTKVSTIVLRGATQNMLAEVERSVVDAVNIVRCICVKNEVEFCAGGGATELEVAAAVHKFGDSKTGLEQYAIHKVAEALEVVPKVLANNSGLDPDETLAALNAAHAKGQRNACVNIEAQGRADSAVIDAVEAGIFDHIGSKVWALRLAMDAVLTVLRIQHIIVSKQAGGPRAPKGESIVDDD
jgi:T-complex protein 1 subunit theta